MQLSVHGQHLEELRRTNKDSGTIRQTLEQTESFKLCLKHLVALEKL